MRRLLYEARRTASSSNRNARSATVFGRLLGAAFVICLLTGLYSHFLQEPLDWMRFPTSPVWLYQVSQGIHITAGIACVPLLLAKLHSVFPQLFQYPPIRHPIDVLERASIAVFVATTILQLVTGLLNTYQYYPWPFPFKQVHFALSFVIIGSLAIHIAVKLPLITRYWRARDSYDAEGRFVEPTAALDPARAAFVGEVEATAELARFRAGRDADPTRRDRDPDAPSTVAPPRGVTGRVMAWIDSAHEVDRSPGREKVSRRGFFAAVGITTGGVVALTAGQSFSPLSPLNAFAPRQQGLGPNDLPINRTASAAQVLETAMDPDWRLDVIVGGVATSFTLERLRALGVADEKLPISCVEGWSQTGAWRGVRLVDLMAAAGAPTDRRIRLTSLEKKGGYRVTEMGPEYVSDPTTLVALELNGEPLSIDHGYPARMIAPGRPGVLQTKWLSSLEVL